MAALSAGKRLKSAVCTTEIMVIAAPDGDVALCCGGAPMSEGGASGGAVDPNYAGGSAIGKRYVNADGSLEVLLIFGVVFGGLIFSAYPLAAAHTNDHLPPEDCVPAAAGLLIAFGSGAVAGPLLAAFAMDIAGPGALFDSVAAMAAGLGAFALYRRSRRPDVDEEEKGAFVVLPRTSPAAYEMDPWSGDGAEGASLVAKDESH